MEVSEAPGYLWCLLAQRQVSTKGMMDFVQQELDDIPQSTLILATHLAAFSSTLPFFFFSPARTNSPCAVALGWWMALDCTGKEMEVT